jgi:hypothetical protein
MIEDGLALVELTDQPAGGYVASMVCRDLAPLGAPVFP